MVKLLVALLVVALAVAGGFYMMHALGNPVPVRTVRLARGDLDVTVTATTTSTVESESYVTVSSRRTGVISELPVEEGDYVRAGQVLARLEMDEISAEEARAEAALELERRRLAQVEAGVSMEKAKTDAARREAESVLWDAESKLVRYELLFNRGMVSRQEYDAVKNARDVAKARFDTAEAELDRNKVKQKDIDSARASVGQAQAALDAVRVQVGYCTITSPLTGVISRLPVEVGETVGAGGVVAELVDPADIYVQSTIDEVDVGRLRLDMPVKIHVDAIPDRLLSGRVTRISPIVSGVKQETRTFEVKVAFDEPMEDLKPGMSADIEVMSRTIKDVLHVPAQSVLERDGNKYVYVSEDGRARLVPVEVGYFSWSDAVLTGGVGEGDTVITTPDATGLGDGARVQDTPEK